MDSENGRPALPALRQEDLEYLSRWNTSLWCASDDPVCRDIVRNVRTGTLRRFSNRQLDETIERLEQVLQEGCEATRPHRFRGYDEDGEAFFDEPDSVDLLLLLHDLGLFGKDSRVNDPDELLQVLCLSESRKGHFGLAIKAFLYSTSERARREWQNRLPGRRKGGRHPKRRDGIYLVTVGLVKGHPTATAKQIWRLFPESVNPVEIDGFSVYRDGDSLFQVDANGREQKLKSSSFNRYVTDAKREMRANSQ